MTCKSYDIPKTLVWEAWLHVKANQGAAGIDAETIERFETKLAANLYKLWNRMSSGSYFPPPVKAVPIPKKSGGVRVLGIPTVSDRIAQTAVKMWLEPRLDPIFQGDSYGYRPGKSALEAIAVTRRRCWDQDWVVEFDIRGLFDNLDHGLLMTALRKHCQEPWILLYVERWLRAPMQSAEGQLQARDKGTPQGGVVSPILANLFLHYAFDLWVTRHLPGVRFARYADDAVLHCKSRRQAEYVLERIRERFHTCNLELHPNKTRIVYCKDINRTEENPDIQFTFLGYTFRPRKAVDKYGRVYVNFSPAVSRDALKAMRQTIRGWRVQLKNDKSLADLSAMLGPILRGWQQYYGHFHGSALKSVWRRVNRSLIGWLMRKHKKLAGHKTRAAETLKRLAQRQPDAFVHWAMGYLS
ncbi:MAG: group II intron reverse transcriptase/maturase [Roseiarcus sp.]|jgi:RNA-directed DNA polymerase